MTVRTRLTAFTSLIILVVVALISVTLFLHERRRVPQDLEQQAFTLARGFAQVCRESILNKDDILPINYIKLFLKGRPDIAQAFFVSREGTILAHTEPALLREQLSSVPEERWGLDATEEGLRPLTFGTQSVVAVAVPVNPGTDIVGMARIDFSRAHWDRLIAEQLGRTARLVLGVAIGALLLGLAGAWGLALLLTRPIHRLMEGAQALGAGQLDHRIPISSNDELGQLGREFNEMGAKLQEVDEMKSSFVSSVSHELRSPLTAIKGYVDQLLKGRGGELNDTHKEYLTIVKNSTARLENFINDILDLAKIEARQLELRLEPVRANAISDEILALFKFQAEEKHLSLASRVPSSLPPVLADQDKLRQVFTNLISNALKFTPENGTITVTAALKDDTVQFDVTDTGLGIPPEDQEHIFDKFRQSKSVAQRARRVKGTGLGLAIVKGIVENHGGKIWVTSRVNHGSTFSFTLPTRR